MQYQKIIISRTDGIGDVILALPMAGLLKELFPECEIIFLAKSYTKAVVETCKHIDLFVAWDELEKLGEERAAEELNKLQADVIIHVFPRKSIAEIAKKAQIPLRIGTSSRYYHWGTCNRLVSLSRRRSTAHEAQLNLKLLISLGAKKKYEWSEIAQYYGFSKVKPLPNPYLQLIDKDKFNLLIHPCSKGSAREWGFRNYRKLLEILPKDQFKIFISGTAAEELILKNEILHYFPEVIDLTCKLTLDELISFLANIDGVFAASTGPLHLGAALGKYAWGVYAPMRPIHPGRWAPIGTHASFFVKDKYCSKCRKSKRCECIESITPEEVKMKIMDSIKQKNI